MPLLLLWLLPATGAATLDAALGPASLWQTAEGSKDRLTQQEDVVFSEAFAADGAAIEISGRPRHEIQGFGGAFTDAAASTMQALDKDKQEELMNSYFGPDGLGFTMGRVHINSCDFSGESYSFDDEDEDWDLKHFDKKVSHDTKALIPMIKRAQELLKEQGLNLSLLASPWSPPAWLKRSGEMDGSDKHCLRDDVDHIWANYISKWITAYEKHGIQVWAITAQNEPEYAAPWEACTWTKEEQTDFLASHLGPVIKKDHPKVLIFAFDHNKDHVHEWAKAVFGNATSSKFTDGIAFHWYTGDGFDAVQKVHEDFPEKILLPSEATFEKASWSSGNEWVEKGVWRFGEGYAHDIIGDLKAGATGWIDWNLILDQDGGPNHVDNVCDAAVIVDKDAGEFHYHPQFYFLGHFSKFIPRGSRYLETTVTGSRTYDGKPRDYGSCWPDDGIQAAAFLRPDGDVALVVLNCADEQGEFKVSMGSRDTYAVIPAHAIQTYVIPVDKAESKEDIITATSCRWIDSPDAADKCPPGSSALTQSECGRAGPTADPLESGSPDDPPGCFSYSGMTYYNNNTRAKNGVEGRKLRCKRCYDAPVANGFGTGCSASTQNSSAGCAKSSELSLNECLASAQVPASSFSILSAKDPAGCFEFNGSRYYNRHPVGSHRAGRSPVCKKCSAIAVRSERDGGARLLEDRRAKIAQLAADQATLRGRTAARGGEGTSYKRGLPFYALVGAAALAAAACVKFAVRAVTSGGGRAVSLAEAQPLHEPTVEEQHEMAAVEELIRKGAIN